jgi:hypothetical protein
LKVDDLSVEVRIGAGRAREAEPGVDLVDLAVRVHTRVVLFHARAVEERRLASIAGSRVDSHVRIIRNAQG